MVENEKLIEEVSEILGIEPPVICYDESKFLTSTQLAGIDLVKNIIYLKPKYKVKFDGYLAICHELRYLWQYNQNVIWQHELISRRRSNDDTDIQYYNSQISEIDANAFGAYYMMNKFRVKPMFKSLDKKTKEKIFKRAEEIKKELRKW